MAKLGIYSSKSLQLYGGGNLGNAEVLYELEPIDIYESQAFTTNRAVLAVRCIVNSKWTCVYQPVKAIIMPALVTCLLRLVIIP